MWFPLAAVVAAMWAGQTGRPARKCEMHMNEILNLYRWVRNDASIHLARIAGVRTQPAEPGQEKVALQVRIDETLWGSQGERMREFEMVRPVSEVAQLKYPDPIWGLVTFREATPMLLVLRGAEVVYAEEIGGPKDPVLTSVRAVVEFERTRADSNARVSRYLRWLAEGSTVERLFGAEALAKDGLTPAGHPERVAAAFARAFGSELSLPVRLSLGEWMWDSVFPGSNAAGQVAIINATIESASDAAAEIRDLALDRLVEAEPGKLHQPGVVAGPQVIRLLEARLTHEPAPEARKQIERVIAALRR